MTTTCPACGGYGFRYNSFNQPRRCGTCKGRKVVDQAVAEQINAMAILHNAVFTCPDKRLGWDATSGLSLLRDREPQREASLVESVLAGRVTDVVRCLASYYRDVYPG